MCTCDFVCLYSFILLLLDHIKYLENADFPFLWRMVGTKKPTTDTRVSMCDGVLLPVHGGTLDTIIFTECNQRIETRQVAQRCYDVIDLAF